MATCKEPITLELGSDGNLRDPDSGEIYGHVPIRFRSLYAAAPELLAACEFIAKYAAMRQEKGDPLPSQITLAVSRALAIANGETVSA